MTWQLLCMCMCQADALLNAVSRRGVFVMIDLLRAPNESLGDYQKRSQADVSGNWITLNKDEHASFRDHMLKVIHPDIACPTP